MFLDKQNLINLIIFQFLLITNFLIYILNTNVIFIVINTSFIFVLFFYLTLFKIHKELTYTKVTILILSIISLGSPLISMDGRGIWMFHAKRIFFDENIYASFDNYLEMFQNDYPTIITSFSASIGFFINGWNEIFPKFACLIFFIPPFLYLSFILKNKMKQFLFCLMVLIILEKKIIIGEMDALVSIYFLTIAIGLTNFSINLSNPGKNLFNQDLVFLFLNIFIFSLIKTETIGIIVIIMSLIIAILFIKKADKIKYLFFFAFSIISIFPWLFWKYKTSQFILKSTSSTWFDISLIYERITDFSLYFKIFHLVLFNTHSIVSLLLFTILLSRIKWNKINFLEINNNFKKSYELNIGLIIFISSIIYLMVIFFGLMTSNFLYTSFNETGKNFFRYSLPVSFSLSFLSIYLIDKTNLLYTSNTKS